jgi:hypothetical protein
VQSTTKLKTRDSDETLSNWQKDPKTLQKALLKIKPLGGVSRVLDQIFRKQSGIWWVQQSGLADIDNFNDGNMRHRDT